MKTHEICVLSHSYIFNINVKYTLHLVRLIIQMNIQDTKEKLQTGVQIVFCYFSVRCPFLTNQTLKEKYTYCTGSRNLYKLLDYSHTGPRNIYRFLTFSFRLYFIVNYAHTIYILLFIYLFLALSYNIILSLSLYIYIKSLLLLQLYKQLAIIIYILFFFFQNMYNNYLFNLYTYL